MNKTQRRVKTVLDRLAKMVENEDDAEVLSIELDCFLEMLNSNDFFGTEGQNDPRGDFRDGCWDMGRVQGIDR